MSEARTAHGRKGPTASAVLAARVLAGGCVRYRPAPVDASALSAGAVTQEHDNVRVSVVVPGDDEVERLFGVPLTKYGIQPVGFVIANDSRDFYWFAHLAVDPDYFTPIEAANRARYVFGGSANEEMRQHFIASAIGSYVGPGQSISGFIFTNLEPRREAGERGLDRAAPIAALLLHDSGLQPRG
jgi:hypothetical protein